MTYRIATITDTHSGHASGLLMPGVKLEVTKDFPGLTSGWWMPELTEYNKRIYNLYMRLYDRTAQSKHPIGLIHGGELTYGAKYPMGVLDVSIATQVALGHASLLPWYKLKNLKWVRIVTGTPVHEYDDAHSASLIIARQLRAEFPKVDTRVVDHALIDVEGVRIDVAHHGSGAGNRIWLKGNEMRYYLRDRILRDILAGTKPPDLFIRGHVHVKHSEVLDVGDGKERRMVVLPSYLGDITAFAKKVTKSEFQLTNGGAIFTVDDGQITAPEWVTDTIDLRVKEQWKN